MQAGTRIGDFEMIRHLGTGGMAEVWLARNPHMNRQFAVKFILPHLAANREIQARFRDEAWRQSGLHHPNIVQIFTVVTEGEQNYIAMEYVENSLDRYLHALGGRPMPVPESIDIAIQVLDALEYTHSLPEGALIHRDIKPSNILIKADGAVRLTDFGIALATREARKTVTGQVLGTSLYMSPEQITAPARVGPASDIYSFACVLYEMLTGQPPFGTASDTDFTIQTEHVNRMPDPLRSRNPNVPARFEWILWKAMAKDPAFRFQTCREMAHALLIAYREENLPMEMLRSYRGGLTAAWVNPHPAQQPQQPAYPPTVAQPYPQPASPGPGTPRPPAQQSWPQQTPVPPQQAPAPAQQPWPQPQSWPGMQSPAISNPASPNPAIPNSAIPNPAPNNPWPAAASGGHGGGYNPGGYPASGAQSMPPGYNPGNPSAQLVAQQPYSTQPVAQIPAQHPVQPLAPPARKKGGLAKPLLIAVAVLFVAAVAAGVWWFTRGEVILRLEGSTSVGDKLAPALASAYMDRVLHASGVHTDVRTAKDKDGKDYKIFEIAGRVNGAKKIIHIVSNGSGNAFTALAGQTADLGMASRPYSSTDSPDLSYLPASNANEHVIALDGIAVIVNPANHISSLSISQLRSIFTGLATQWSDVGGTGGHIHCYGRELTSGTYEMFRNKVVGSKGKLTAIDPADQFSNGQSVVDKVLADPDGIGYVTFTQAGGVRSVAVSDQGTMPLYPNALTVSTEDYVLTRRLYLYQPRDSSKQAADFISFVQTPDGQNVVATNDFVSLIPKVHPFDVPLDAPSDYREAVAGKGRLGISFRFTSGNASLAGGDQYTLDSLAEDNVLRLKNYIQEHPNDQITLLGFTDSRPSRLKSNKELAMDRANSVARELEQNGINAQVFALGDEMPVASNATPDGQAKNRRVEVWVRSSGGQ